VGGRSAASRPLIAPYGDAAVLAWYADVIDPEVNARVHALAAAVRAVGADHGWGHPVPSYASLLIPYDPLLVDAGEAVRRISTLADGLPAAPKMPVGPLVEIPVRYGGPDGPDLDELAASHGLVPADVIELHSMTEYRCFMLGFSPGFGYLGVVPAEIATPRRSSPRERVAAGSVGIAGSQTGVYPSATPGGWNLIGRTGAEVWDLRRDPPALLGPGVRVRFRPVTEP
jgi:KipI family sensor histidine kinase inhibitor